MELRACLHVSGLLKWVFLLVARQKFESSSDRVKSWLPERHRVLS